MAYTHILNHIIIRTKYSDKALELEKAPELYKYIWGIVKRKGCILYRINGMEDHIHMLCDLHPSVALADLIKAIKGSAGKWIKASGHFPKFRGWGVKYCALTYACQQKDIIEAKASSKKSKDYGRSKTYKKTSNGFGKKPDLYPTL